MKTTPTMKTVIAALANKHGIDIREANVMLRLDMVGFDQLCIERLPNGCISVAHIYEAQGFRIPEPDVCFFVNAEGDWTPINITQSMTGYRSYAELSEDGTTILRYNRAYQAELADFCEQWAQNLRDQGWLEQGRKHENLNWLPLPTGKKARFALGRVVATPGALEALEQAGQSAEELLARHVTADWGDLDEHDRNENARALKEGGRLFSAYHLRNQTKLWLITEWDRSVSTLLRPEEY